MKPWLKFLKDEQGMTLVEVIVALVLFVFVFAILLSGINMALKVMGNAKATNDATLNDASKIESLGSSLEKENSATVTGISGTVLSINGYRIGGQFKLATTKKSNDKTDLSLAFFDSEAPAHTVPLPTVPPDTGESTWEPFPPNTKTELEKLGAKFDDEFINKNTGRFNNGSNGAIGERCVVTTPLLIELSNKGVNKAGQLFFLSTITVGKSKENVTPEYNSDFFYFGGDISTENPGAIFNLGELNFEGNILVYFKNQGDSQANVQITTKAGTYSVKEGYYLIPTDSKKGTYDILSAVKAEEQTKFETAYAEGGSGYYLDINNSDPDIQKTCKAILKYELDRRQIKVIDVNGNPIDAKDLN